MKRKFLIGLLFSLLILSGITVSADSDGTYVYSVSGDAATITGIADKTAFSGEQVIPEKIGGYSVTKIQASAFKGCTGLTSITVPDSVTSIGSGAFSGCSSLYSITVPYVSGSQFGYIFGTTSYTGGTSTRQYYGDSYDDYYTYYIPTALKKVTVTRATSLAYGAFYNCSNITEINLNGEITSIGDKAFYNCSSLNAMVIPQTTNIVGAYAFYNCDSLTNVIIPNSVTAFGIEMFCNFVQSEKVELLIMVIFSLKVTFERFPQLWNA